jgi:hypothetical protein
MARPENSSDPFSSLTPFLLLWGNVSRAADVLPPGLEVDPRNLPPVQAGGGDEPLFPGLGGSQLVAHGIDVGIMWQW